MLNPYHLLVKASVAKGQASFQDPAGKGRGRGGRGATVAGGWNWLWNHGMEWDYPLVMTNIANWKDPPCY